MSADLPPCVLCGYCTDKSTDFPYQDRDGSVGVRIKHKLTRSCGAGPTSDPDEHCVNGKYIPRTTVVVYVNTGTESKPEIIVGGEN